MNSLIPIGEKAREASRVLALAGAETKKKALYAIAAALEKNEGAIITQNEIDVKAGHAGGLTSALIDRLTLNIARIKGIADSVREVAELPDPIGRVISETERLNGLKLQKVTVPLGVIGVIFEARPNVSADSAALCLKSGNAVILRGGKEAIRSNSAIVDIMGQAIEEASLPADCVQLIRDTSRESARELMTLNGYVDVLIPRGGQGLIKAVVEGSSVPAIETGAGVCHTYVDKESDINMAAEIIFNAKTSRPSVCNACECMLIHEAIAEKALPVIAERLYEKNVEIRGDEGVCAILPGAVKASDGDWGMEYGDYIIAARIVKDAGEAMEHIFRYGTMHSECIVTSDASAAEEFLNGVDAAAVYVNASTRFTDGGEFGLGAEIGISTQKLHARGPLGLNELCSYKYKVFGRGQVR